jgi:adenosylhomocysteine nucleosidase
MNRIAIIAAMEREIGPLLQRGWRKDMLSAGTKKFVAFQHDAVLVVISGIGRNNAELAARTAIDRFQPSLLMSVGLAGALIRSLKVGNVFTPSVVVDAADGAEFRCSADKDRVSGGVLVSSAEVAGAQAKQKLVSRFHALVVDMEAAGVARAARQGNIGFRCVKTISDEADFAMPPMEKFIDSTGHFQSNRFAGWAALRPWQWPRVAALARNSRRATAALCQWLEKHLNAGSHGGDIVTLNRAGFLEAKH